MDIELTPRPSDHMTVTSLFKGAISIPGKILIHAIFSSIDIAVCTVVASRQTVVEIRVCGVRI